MVRSSSALSATALLLWSLLAPAAYASVELAACWLYHMSAAVGLIAWFAQVAAPLDGPPIAIVWLVCVPIRGALTGLVRPPDIGGNPIESLPVLKDRRQTS